MRIVTKQLKLKLRGRESHYKEALHLSYPRVKFDDKI